MTNGPVFLRFQSVTKRFGPVAAVDDVSLDIEEGAFIALLGPSGCGKTTLLRLLAGLEAPDRGRILLDGTDITDIPPHRRPVNLMFQNYALFPHLSVADNVAFGLRQERGWSSTDIRNRVGEMLDLVRMADFAARMPDQLSGGQSQRVALARALAKSPKVLLLDEPLAALDRKLREETRAELARLHEKLGTTFIIVTHDQDEAMSLADRIAVMDKGKIVQFGTPTEIYEQPNSLYVADFVGGVNLIRGRVAEIVAPHVLIETEVGPACIARADCLAEGDHVVIGLRPEKAMLARERPYDPSLNALPAIVSSASYRGDVVLYRLDVEGKLTVKVSVQTLPSEVPPIEHGEQVFIVWRPEAAFLIPN